MSDYYEIAYNDYLYMTGSEDTCQYNNLCAGAQQVAEKLLKSVALAVLPPEEGKITNSHNLRALYRKIREYEPRFILKSEADLAALKDMYFDARYPGENYFVASKEDYEECKRTAEEVILRVNEFRNGVGLPVKDFRPVENSFRDKVVERIGMDFAELLLNETPAGLQDLEHLDILIEEFKKRHLKMEPSENS